ncbi:hypothetical protein M885DRAFT_588338 [Pelagophyceae sp. CCMP2097]|nr:hypothetical protein M885DRAFT_588338 [Pelagophyceae sp. CCMP2097]
MRLARAAVVGLWCAVGAAVLEGKREILDDDLEIVWQAPKHPTGIVVIAHGCSHSATDAWPTGKGCAECIGLPIETQIVGALLEHNWAVVAVSSFDRLRNRCWRINTDVPRVWRAVQHVDAQLGNLRLPVAALGASSGGALATALPGLVGAVSQVMPSSGDSFSPQHAPVRFVHMGVRDRQRARAIKKQVFDLKAAGVDAEEVVVSPSPVTVAALTKRLGYGGTQAALSVKVAEECVAALLRAGLVDAQGLLLDDPRKSGWRAVLRPFISVDEDSFGADVSRMSEVLNAAWAQHEFTDDGLDSILAWLDEKRQAHRKNESKRYRPEHY